MILGNAASAYHAQLGHFPDGLQELADFCSQNPTLCTLDAALASGTDGSTNYYVGTANGGIWTVEAEPDCVGITGSTTVVLKLSQKSLRFPIREPITLRQASYDKAPPQRSVHLRRKTLASEFCQQAPAG